MSFRKPIGRERPFLEAPGAALRRARMGRRRHSVALGKIVETGQKQSSEAVGVQQVIDEFLGSLYSGVIPFHVADCINASGGSRGVHQTACLLDSMRHRFLGEHMLAGTEGFQGERCRGGSRCAYDHGVDTRIIK